MKIWLKKIAYRVWLYFHGPWRERTGDFQFDETQTMLERGIGWQRHYSIYGCKAFINKNCADSYQFYLARNLNDIKNIEQMYNPIQFGWIVRFAVEGLRP